MTKARLPKLSCDKHKDPVARKVRDTTAKEFVDWMVKYHGLPKSSVSTVLVNLDEQFKYHNLRGRLQAGALTADKLADSLDAFWNAAIGSVRQDVHSGPTTMETVGAVAQGFAAVSAELRKGGVA